ncbi:MAG: hypothetical protein MK179_23085, partial [Pirellulaceae bacterium]|nr:hypothetical protein [Pirellulaceae bacterium]
GGPMTDTDVISIDVQPVTFADSPTWTTFPGALDTSFSDDGIQILSFTESTPSSVDYLSHLYPAHDGKIIGVGLIDEQIGLVGFNADMSLDATFGTNGIVQTGMSYGIETALIGKLGNPQGAVQDNQGRILVAGVKPDPGNPTHPDLVDGVVARYTLNGTLDTTFGINGYTGHEIPSLFIGGNTTMHKQGIPGITLQPNGGILISSSGAFSQFEHGFILSRFDSNGVFDWTTQIDDGVTSGFNTHEMPGTNGIISQNDGSILVAGTKELNHHGGPPGNRDEWYVARVNSNGEKEADFAFELGRELVRSAIPLPDGKVLLVGRVTDNGEKAQISRHLPDGNLDPTFGSGGWLDLNFDEGVDDSFRITLQPDGKLVVVGATSNGVGGKNVHIARWTYDGQPDPSFDVDGKLLIPFDNAADNVAYTSLILPNGKILLAGRSGDDIALVRLLGDSKLDSFAANQPPVNSVPGSQTATENVPLAFTAYRSNQISTSDADAGLNPVEVTLTAAHGAITLVDPDPSGGLTYSVGDGTEDATMTFTGKLTDINKALSWLAFVPETDYVGTEASLTISTNDQGYFGTGGPMTDTDVISIDVQPVTFADSPTWT